MYQTLQETEFDCFYHILLMYFPKEEVKEYAFMKNMFMQGKTKVIVKKENNKIISAICYVLLKEDVFIDYFVVIKEYQGQRHGQRMLQYFKDYMNKPILLEVELPTNETKKRRLSFYQREGFIRNEYLYTIPPIRSLKQPLTFLLLSYPNRLSKKEYKKKYTDILKTVYEIG